MGPNRERRPRLHGREAECETLAGLVSEVRCGHGAVLSVRGARGTGKTALLDYTRGLAEDLLLLRAGGAEPEAGLPYAGLHQLSGSLAGRPGQLPEPQRIALETVFGVRAGAADRFLVGLGVLGLLTGAAAGTPVICVVDDAHWLDPASVQALAFAARRLTAEPVLMIFASREPVTDLAGLPELLLSGLRDGDARDLLAATARWPLDERVREQIVAEARGNPRMLLELRDLSPAQLAGGFRPAGPPPGGVPAGTQAELAGLPTPVRLLLAAAAADPTGDPARLERAAAGLGLTAEAVLPAAEAGLITMASRVLFRDRLTRAAAYHCAPLRDRRAVHLALARAIDPAADPADRAWHQAEGCGAPTRTSRPSSRTRSARPGPGAASRRRPPSPNGPRS